MNCNSEELIKDIRAKFEDILNFVSGEAANKATAEHIERNLFKFLGTVNFSSLKDRSLDH